MRIVWGDIVIEVEPGEEAQAAELLRALQGPTTRRRHSPGRGRKAFTDEDIERLKHLRAGGLGTELIAQEMGVARSTVRGYLQKLGLLDSQQPTRLKHPSEMTPEELANPVGSTRVHLPPEEDEP